MGWPKCKVCHSAHGQMKKHNAIRAVRNAFDLGVPLTFSNEILAKHFVHEIDALLPEPPADEPEEE